MGKILDWLQERVILLIGDRPQEGNEQRWNVFDCLCPGVFA